MSIWMTHNLIQNHPKFWFLFGDSVRCGLFCHFFITAVASFFCKCTETYRIRSIVVSIYKIDICTWNSRCMNISFSTSLFMVIKKQFIFGDSINYVLVRRYLSWSSSHSACLLIFIRCKQINCARIDALAQQYIETQQKNLWCVQIVSACNMRIFIALAIECYVCWDHTCNTRAIQQFSNLLNFVFLFSIILLLTWTKKPFN